MNREPYTYSQGYPDRVRLPSFPGDMSRARRPKKKLGHLADHRARLSERTAGRGVLRVARVGYTNAGKSTATSLGWKACPSSVLTADVSGVYKLLTGSGGEGVSVTTVTR